MYQKEHSVWKPILAEPTVEEKADKSFISKKNETLEDTNTSPSPDDN